MDMCRFTGLDDVEYKKVAAALNRMTTSEPKTTEAQSLNDDQRQALMDSLRFEQMDARQMSVKTAHAKTCKWLLKRPEYLDWLDMEKLDQHHGFLWIKGKPGWKVDSDEVCDKEVSTDDERQNHHLLLFQCAGSRPREVHGRNVSIATTATPRAATRAPKCLRITWIFVLELQ